MVGVGVIVGVFVTVGVGVTVGVSVGVGVTVGVGVGVAVEVGVAVGVGVGETYGWALRSPAAIEASLDQLETRLPLRARTRKSYALPLVRPLMV